MSFRKMLFHLHRKLHPVHTYITSSMRCMLEGWPAKTLMTTFCGLSIRRQRRRAADAFFRGRCGNAMNNVALFIGRGVDVMRCILQTKLTGMHIQGSKLKG